MCRIRRGTRDIHTAKESPFASRQSCKMHLVVRLIMKLITRRLSRRIKQRYRKLAVRLEAEEQRAFVSWHSLEKRKGKATVPCVTRSVAPLCVRLFA